MIWKSILQIGGTRRRRNRRVLRRFLRHVRALISDKTDEETMRRLFNPRDGLPVDMEKIVSPSRR